jgi:hypothetical protein
VVAQLEPVVGQVPDLEHERDEVEGQKNDPGPHQPDEDVELEVRLFPVLPWQGQVDEKPRNAFVNYVRLKKNVTKFSGNTLSLCFLMLLFQNKLTKRCEK